MKYTFNRTISFVSLLICGGWGSQESSIDGSKKPVLNFQATLVTQANQTLKIENILIGGMLDNIQVYDSSITPEMSRASTCLVNDPTKGIGTTLALENIFQIEVPEPEVTWYYEKRTDGPRCTQTKLNDFEKNNFIEIIITSNNDQKTKHQYLISTQKTIHCNEIGDPSPKQIPLSAIRLLTISQPPIAREAEKYKNGSCTPAEKP